MKKIFSKFTFWFFIASIFIILFNWMGYDDMNILLISFNPILDTAVYSVPYRSSIWNNGPNYNMYFMHLLTFMFYGAMFDVAIYITKITMKRLKKRIFSFFK